jgi:hypothetical protein
MDSNTREFVLKCFAVVAAIILVVCWLNIYSKAKDAEVAAQGDAVHNVVDAFEDSNKETRDAYAKLHKEQLAAQDKMVGDALQSFNDAADRSLRAYADTHKQQLDATRELVNQTLASLDQTEEKAVYVHYWNLKLDLFHRAANEATRMVLARNEYEDARREFLILHRGQLALVLGEKGRQAVNAFVAAIPETEPETEEEERKLEEAANALTVALKQELAAALADPLHALGAD